MPRSRTGVEKLPPYPVQVDAAHDFGAKQKSIATDLGKRYDSPVPLPERLELYRKIEELRGRPLLVYITSPRPNANASMAADAIPEFLDQLEVLPRETNKIDL